MAWGVLLLVVWGYRKRNISTGGSEWVLLIVKLWGRRVSVLGGVALLHAQGIDLSALFPHGSNITRNQIPYYGTY